MNSQSLPYINKKFIQTHKILFLKIRVRGLTPTTVVAPRPVIQYALIYDMERDFSSFVIC